MTSNRALTPVGSPRNGHQRPFAFELRRWGTQLEPGAILLRRSRLGSPTTCATTSNTRLG